ncbi:hypothetical protein DFJ74DRAFT_218948 [Hyaloraphidium curvatum]|nr:hypothetical protein DFJ74DRAFT_218948 [Hyaloraphidium curvatum]
MWKHQCRTVLDPARPTFSAPCNITAGETGAPLWIVETGPRTSSGIRLVGVWTSFANGTSESQARIANGDVASFLGAADRLGPSPCGSHCSRDAVCTSDGQSATCICKAGFAGNGLVCKRKPNPCLVNNGGCRPEATCTNSFGEAQCQCKPGYFARAGICVRTNPCLVEHGGCSFNATCDNVSPGTARCSCKPGFAGNGRACAFVDACQYEQYNGRPCAPNATCANLGMDAVCTCKPGFVGDGKTKCFPDPCIDGGGCSANATCSWNSTTGVARCACNPDWVGDGQTCFEDLCTPDRINATCGIPEFYSSCSTDPATGAPSCVCVQPGQENPYSLPKCRCSYGTEPKRDPITGNINCETVYVCCQIFRPPAPSLSCRSMVSCLHPAPDLGCCSGG